MKRLLALILTLSLLLSAGLISASALESKISDELKTVIDASKPTDIIGLKIVFAGEVKYRFDMPSYPDYEKADEELDAYYEDYYKHMCGKVFEGIEYTEVHKNSNAIVVNIKVANIGKIASFSEVEKLYYCSDLEQEYILYATPQLLEYNFKEVYYHYDENDDLSWVLLKAALGFCQPAACGMDMGNIVVHSHSIFSKFTYQYGIYDAKEDKVYDLRDLRKTPDKYDGLCDKLVELNIATPIGDSDMDGKVTVMDATFIARYVAQLEDLNYRDRYNVVVYYYEEEEKHSGFVSDFDNDGEVTILDATAIQRMTSIFTMQKKN